MSLHSSRPLLAAFVGAALVLGGCGIRSTVEDAVETAVEEGAEAAQEAAEEAAAEVAENAVDEAAESVGDKLQDAADGATAGDGPLDPSVLADADSFAEADLADGGRIAVAVQCESAFGGNLIHVGLVGVAPGIYDGELVPAAGGGVDIGVTEEGRGVGIRQATLDQPSYTVSYPMIDDGVSLTVDGCPQ